MSWKDVLRMTVTPRMSTIGDSRTSWTSADVSSALGLHLRIASSLPWLSSRIMFDSDTQYYCLSPSPMRATQRACLLR
jgi:hypothetical protein